MRRDPAPLMRRFDAIGDPLAVRWMSGVVGVDDGASDAQGPFLTGDALDAELSTAGLSTDAYLSAEGDTLVLVSLDD